MSEANKQAGSSGSGSCYVAILKRAIPVNDCSTDTSSHIIEDGESVSDVMEWAERLCKGSAAMISVEITKAT